MPTEMLFEKSHQIIIGLIIIVIAAIVIVSVLSAMGAFESSKIPYAINVSAPEVMLLGSQMSVTIRSIEIKTGPQNIDIMPVATYQGAIGYNEANVVSVVRGTGTNIDLKFTITPPSMPSGQIWITMTYWKWSKGGCIDKTIADNTQANYASLAANCAADFIKSETMPAVR